MSIQALMQEPIKQAANFVGKTEKQSTAHRVLARTIYFTTTEALALVAALYHTLAMTVKAVPAVAKLGLSEIPMAKAQQLGKMIPEWATFGRLSDDHLEGLAACASLAIGSPFQVLGAPCKQLKHELLHTLRDTFPKPVKRSLLGRLWKVVTGRRFVTLALICATVALGVVYRDQVKELQQVAAQRWEQYMKGDGKVTDQKPVASDPVDPRLKYYPYRDDETDMIAAQRLRGEQGGTSLRPTTDGAAPQATIEPTASTNAASNESPAMADSGVANLEPTGEQAAAVHERSRQGQLTNEQLIALEQRVCQGTFNPADMSCSRGTGAQASPKSVPVDQTIFGLGTNPETAKPGSNPEAAKLAGQARKEIGASANEPGFVLVDNSVDSQSGRTAG